MLYTYIRVGICLFSFKNGRRWCFGWVKPVVVFFNFEVLIPVSELCWNNSVDQIVEIGTNKTLLSVGWFSRKMPRLLESLPANHRAGMESRPAGGEEQRWQNTISRYSSNESWQLQLIFSQRSVQSITIATVLK